MRHAFKCYCIVVCATLVELCFFPFSNEVSGARFMLQDSNRWFINMKMYSNGAHGSLSCESCHGNMKKNGKYHPDLGDRDKLLRRGVELFDYARCKKCHRKSYERYLLGEHAKALKSRRIEDKPYTSKDRLAPTCGDCHDAHYEKSHLSRVQIGINMTEICGSCHLPEKLTYLADFHGRRAVNLSYKAAAYCTDCHGAHNCSSLKDKKRALAVCQRCHPNATSKFVEYVIHPSVKGLGGNDKEKEQKVRLIRAVAGVMGILVAFVVAFFYGHSLLWFLRELHEKLRKH